MTATNANSRGWLKGAWDETQAINARVQARARRWDAIYRAGGGTATDYIRADFDTIQPDGLDVRPWDSVPIRLENIFKGNAFQQSGLIGKMHTAFSVGGRVEGQRHDKIQLNPISYSPIALFLQNAIGKLPWESRIHYGDIIAHEFIHTRQHYYDNGRWSRLNRDNNIQYVGMNELPLHRRLLRQAIRFEQNFSLDALLGAGNVESYYAQHIEMQARMHEVLAEAYADWQKLPTSKIELWAALANCGFDTPDAIRDELDNTQSGRIALREFKLLPSIQASVTRTVSTFNNVQKYAGEKDIQEGLWRTQYPLMYGELLEFYGDVPGRARMGMGANPRPAIEALYAIKGQDIDDTEAWQLSESFSPALAMDFLNNAIINFPEGSENFESVMKISEALLTREDVREYMFADRMNSRAYLAQPSIPPLVNAIHRGHHPMLALLTRSGASLFQTYYIHDMRDKAIFSCSPSFVVDDILEEEENLHADPSTLPKGLRKNFKDTEKRQDAEQWVSTLKSSLQTILDNSPDPDLAATAMHRRDSSRVVHTTLRKALARVGVAEDAPQESHDLTSDLA